MNRFALFGTGILVVLLGYSARGQEAELAMQELRFGEAAELLEGVPGADGRAVYLRALALYLAGKHEESVVAAVAVPRDSKWGDKAAFLRAEALAAVKKHGEVAEIYAEEAGRIFGTDRKEEIAKLLEEMGDEIVAKERSGEQTEGEHRVEIAKAEGLFVAALELPVGAEMRERLHYKVVKLRERLGVDQSLRIWTRKYLWLFVPEGTGEAERSEEEVPAAIDVEGLGDGVVSPEGHLDEVRLLMLEAELAAGEKEKVRNYAEAYLGKVEEGSEVAGELAWLVCRSFGPLPVTIQSRNSGGNSAVPVQPGNSAQPVQQAASGSEQVSTFEYPEEFEAPMIPQILGYLDGLENSAADGVLYLEVLEKFLEEYPGHARVVDALGAQSRQLQIQGKLEEALVVYGKILALPNLEENDENMERVTALRNAKEEVQFQLGDLHSRLGSREEAIRQWRVYVNAFPNGKFWEDAQGLMVDAEVRMGLDAVQADDFDGARRIFGEFLTRYPLDERARMILFVLGQMEYAEAEKLEVAGAADEAVAAAWEEAVEEWGRLVGKYPDSEEASLAAYRSAVVVGEKLGRKEEGVDRLKKIGWGAWADPARARVKLLEDKSLAAVSGRVWRIGEDPEVNVRVRNIEKLKVSQFRLGLEEFFRRKHELTPETVDSLDIDLIEPELTWEVDVAEDAGEEVKVAARIQEGPGVRILRVEGGGWESAALVVRSDLQIVVNSAQREALISVQGPGGSAVGDAFVLVSDGEKVVGEGKTEEDGTFRITGDAVRGAASLCVYVRAEGLGEAMAKMGLGGMTASMLDQGFSWAGTDPAVTRRALMGTDKEVYAPGERVRWSGLVRDVVEGKYAVPAGREYRLFLLDGDGRSLRDVEVALSEHGEFSGGFDLPEELPTGSYRLRIAREDGGEAHEVGFFVHVRAEAARILELEIGDASPVRGDEIRGTVRARWWFGDVFAGERVTVSLPDGKTVEGVTNETGEFEFSVSTDRLPSGRELSITAYAPRLSLTARAAVKVRTVGVGVRLERSPTEVVAGDEFGFRFGILGGGKPEDAGLKVKVERVEDPVGHAVLEAVPWLGRPGMRVKKVGVLERDADLSRKVESERGGIDFEDRLMLEEAGEYEVSVSGKDGKGNGFLRLFRVQVVDGEGVQKLFVSVAKPEVAEGGEAELTVRSVAGAERALLVVAGDVIESYRFVKLVAGKQVVRFPVGEGLWPNVHVRLTYVDGDGLHSRGVELEVKRGLRVGIDVAEGAVFLPGGKVRATVTAEDLLGNPVAAGVHVRVSGWRMATAESLALMDRSAEEYFRRGERVRAAFRSGGSAGFAFLGKSRVVSEGEDGSRNVVGTANDMERQLRLGILELEANPGNGALLDRNADLVLGNGYLSEGDVQRWRDSLYANGVRILTEVPDESAGEFVEMERRGDGAAVVWLPEVRTGADGKAVVEFTLPEEEGEWRLAVAGAAGVGKFGDVVRTVVTRREVGVTLVNPGGLRVGDAWRPTVIFDTGRELRKVGFALMRERDGEEIVLGKSELERNGVGRFVGEAVKIEKGDGPILKWGVRVGDDPVIWAETAVNGAGLFEVVKTDGGDLAAVAGLEGEVATEWERPALFFAALALGEVTDGEWRGRADTAAAGEELLAAVSALGLFEGEDGDAEGRKSPRYGELRERVRSLVGLLQVMQFDGGWRWNEIGALRDTVTTAAAFRGMVAAKRLGFEVEEDALKRAEAYLAEALAIVPPEEPEKSAMILHALSLRGKADFSVANRLHRGRAELGGTSLAYLAAAFFEMGREEMAGDCVGLLVKDAVKGDGSAHWNGSGVVSRLSPAENTTAMALWSLTKAGGNEALCGEVAGWLMRQQGAVPWGTGKAHGTVAAALCAHFRGKEGKLRGVTRFGSEPVGEGKGGGIAGLRVLGKRMVHEGIFEGGSVVGTSSSPVSHAEYGQRIRVEVEVEDKREVRGYLVWDEAIPGGCALVPGSLRGNFAKVEKVPAGLRLYYQPGQVEDLEYDLVAVVAGGYSVPATRVRDAYEREKSVLGEAGELVILEPGVESPDPYEMNVREHFALAEGRFRRGDYAGAETALRAYLEKAGKGEGVDERGRERELARMMLWIETAKEEPAAKEVVRWFEVINERHSDTVVPFDKVLAVARAYREIGEFERSWLVNRAAIGGSFFADASASAVLEDHGDYFGSVALQQRLWEEYPDSDDVVAARFALSQDLVQKAENPASVRVRDAAQKPTRERLLERGKEVLEGYLTLYASRDGMEGAAFSLANVLFLLKDYAGMVRRSEITLAARPEGEMADTFHYLAALGHFWQIDFAKALESAEKVVESKSRDRDFARYVTAQIYHAMGEAEKAILWYQKVEEVFDDARESKAALEERSVVMPEVTTVRPGDAAVVVLRYRNIRSAALQIFKVDLMKLYLREKNLGNISEVDLAGIASESELAVELGEGKDFEWKERGIDLGLKDEGAYLVICRGDGLFSSGLVLISPLELKAKEERYGGFVRLSVRDVVKGEPVADAEVKAVGGEDGKFASGRTDPRGALQLGGLKGKATVIVRQEGGRYAIFRGTEELGGGESSEGTGALIPSLRSKSPEKSEYLKNIQTDNFLLQEKSNKEWNEKRMKGGKGIEAKDAFKMKK